MKSTPPTRNDDVKQSVYNWINEDERTEWRSAREWQILYYLQIDTAKEPQKLSYLVRLSYDLQVPYDALFDFCAWSKYLIEAVPMSAQCYTLEFTYVSDLLKEYGLLRDGKVNETNLWKVCAACAKLDRKITPAGWCMLLERCICGCYGIDGPWSWYLRRVLDKQPREAFEYPDYVKQFVEWFVGWLNKMELEAFNECGVPIQSIVWRTPADSRMLA